MATYLHRDPELAAVVERARRRAEEAGQLTPRAFPPFQSKIPPEAAHVLVKWLRDGGYDEAIARIAEEDPDLANQ